MKKLINEVVTLALIISFLSNTLATVTHAAEVPKNHPARTGDKTVAPSRPNYVYDMVPKADGTTAAIPAPKRHAPYTATEKALDFLGVRGSTPAIDPRHATIPDDVTVLPARSQPLTAGERILNLLGLRGPVKAQTGTLISNLQLEAEKQRLLQERAETYKDLVTSISNDHKFSEQRLDANFRIDLARSSNVLGAPTATAYRTSLVSSRQLSELLADANIAKTGRTSSPFYFPAQQNAYELKMSSEEIEEYKKKYNLLKFETAGREGNIYRVRITNSRNAENMFVGFKVDKELAKKFSPKMLEDTLANRFKEAGSHAAATFPMEALTFYIGIYINTLLNLAIQYENDPAAIEKANTEAKSIAGQLSFFAFMLGNRMFTSSLTPMLNNMSPSTAKAILGKLIPFFGMGIGSIASAGFHDVVTLTKGCAIGLMKADEFDEKASEEAMNACQGAYNQVISSSNLHNYITSFMNIIVAGAGSAVLNQLIVTTAKTAARGSIGAIGAASGMTSSPALASGLARTSLALEGMAFEMSVASQESAAYSLSKNLTRTGKLSTTTRLANWFGYVKNKPGNFFRVGLRFGRLGWQIAGGIVIFLQLDERARPYTYKFEQELLGAGSTLDGLMKRHRVQMDHLTANNWNQDICQEHGETNKRTGFKSYYTRNPLACDLMKNTESIKENSKLWREALHYKFMGAYSNWLMYVENYHSQWNMTQTFYDQFIQYADLAKLAEYDPAKSETYNPLLHDDDFTGVMPSERIANAEALSAYKTTFGDDFTFDGMNVIRAQRVIDILPIIGKKLKEIKSQPKLEKDWSDVKTTLLEVTKYITAYMILNELSKGRKMDRVAVVKEHFSKATLNAQDLASYKDYSPLVHTIDIINKNFDNYASAYKSSEMSGPARDRTPQEAQHHLSLYQKANFFKSLRRFLGNPRPSARGEAFVRVFDATLKSTYTPEQIKKSSTLTGSVGKDLLWHALCGTNFIGMGKIEDRAAEEAVSDSSWGKNVNFKVPRLVEKIDLSVCKGFDNIIPTRVSKSKNTKMDFLMKNLSPTLITDTGSNFSVVWQESILPKISQVYDKFDKSYQILIKDQFIEKFIGKNMENIFGHTPGNAYKYIKNQPRNLLEGNLNTGLGVLPVSTAQSYVDEMDAYLKVLKSVFDASLKQDVALKLASDATEKNKNYYLEFAKKRRERFDILIAQFRNAFVKILLSFGQNNADVERTYSGLLVTFVQLNKSLGVIGDLNIEQENVEEAGEVDTKVVASVSRNQFGELALYQYLLDAKKEEIESFVKAQEKAAGVSNAKTKEYFSGEFLKLLIDGSYLEKTRLRLAAQKEVRFAFEEIRGILETKNGPYAQDRNMSLPLLDNKMNITPAPGTIMYTLSPNMLTKQFLGVMGASKGLDQLIEELYFNVNVLKAASIDNKYRNIEQDQLRKFKSNSMGMGGRGM